MGFLNRQPEGDFFHQALPVIRIGGAGGAGRALITAGIDGDEYTGIEAAYRLAGILKTYTIHGEVIILPLVNRAAFYAGQSRHPQDGKYPKLIYPGSPHGSASERLMWSVSQQYVKGSRLWIDLHAGATEETLVPCVLSYETGYPDTDNLTGKVVGSIGASLTVRETVGTRQKVKRIAADGCGYLMLESGSSGSRLETDIRRHVSWSLRALTVGGWIADKANHHRRSMRVFRTLTEYVSRHQGLWYPVLQAGDTVKKGDRLGFVRTLDRNREYPYDTRTEGVILWQRRALAVIRGNDLCTVASDAFWL